MPDGGPITPGAGLGVATDEITFSLTGTVSKNATTTITGSGTSFTTELSVGQVIRVPGGASTEDRIVDAIASNTSLTVSAAFTTTASGQTGLRVQHVQYVKLMDGTLDGTGKIGGDATNGLDVDVTRVTGSVAVTDNSGSLTVDAPVGTPVFVRLSDGSSAIATLPVSLASMPTLAAGTNNIGDVDVLTVPADPFGANADAVVAAGAAGSMQAKLRRATQGLEDLKSLIVLAAGNNNIGDVDVASVPADPFGANADAAVAAGATGSIQAKLRRATQGLEDLKSLIVLAAGSNLIGKINLSPQTANGLTIYRSLSVDSTGVNIKASAGQVYGWYIANTATTYRYVKFYNKATAPTVGTDTPVLTVPIPPLSAANVEYTNGVAFATGIGIGCVTAVADNSTANVTANDVIANILYA